MFTRIQIGKINQWADRTEIKNVRCLLVQLGSQPSWNLPRDSDQSGLGATWIALRTEFIHMQGRLKTYLTEPTNTVTLGGDETFESINVGSCTHSLGEYNQNAWDLGTLNKQYKQTTSTPFQNACSLSHRYEGFL